MFSIPIERVDQSGEDGRTGFDQRIDSSSRLDVESRRVRIRLGAGYPVTNPPGRPGRRCG